MSLNIKTTDWLTRGMTKEEIAREKEMAIKEAEVELRNKQIEEMAKVIGDADQRCYEIEDCDGCPFHCMELGLCKERFVADALYNAGYRKASEVAEEIFAEIENINAHGDGYYEYWKDWLAKLAELKKKYTEDV